ncbi:protein serine/threonine kinase [Tieghemostelium lacteum]|uniref:non-specific serine/threonine protein kinase n=1 Tax=Tieghemostelium lacteum TaxID=361077 RepID=A0A151ZC76_TIELA|nr:protein serine/threonine kinase [Tieghemostelium lacteum]|eukprot:KYQ91552.1 protein serine/threonine kinase [Tieghemostelium lacteum]
MADKQGFLTKEGGSIKTWRKRWCVLKNGSIYYSKNPSSGELGIIHLKEVSSVQQSSRKKKNCFEVATPDRTYFMKAPSPEDMKSWIDILNQQLQKMKAQQSVKSTVGVEDFDLLKVIGKGSFGKVMQVVKKDTGKIYAMKVLNKKNILERKEIDHTRAERNILKKLVHPFLVNLNYSFQTEDKLYFIMDYVNGGELFYHLQKDEKFDYDRVKFYCAEIVCGLEYLHACGVLYRDLKPENILLTEDGHICMTDFGISKEGLISDNDRTATFCGTPEYLAPEILKGEAYGKAVDWWSFGTLVYEMLTGIPPFYSQDVRVMYNKIMNDKLLFTTPLPTEAKDFISALLERDPEKRLKDPKLIKSHPFFKSIDFEKCVRKEITPPFIPPVSGKTDTSQIDTGFLIETAKLSLDTSNLSTSMQKNFEDFTYINESEHLKEGLI